MAQIDSRYRTDPARRHLMGVSFGGLGTAYIGTQYPDVFHNLTLFSPSFWAADATFRSFDAMTTAPDWKVFVYWGQPEWDVDDLSDWIVGGLQAAGIEATGFHTTEGHSWASWRGVLDEMLEYFYGTARRAGERYRHEVSAALAGVPPRDHAPEHPAQSCRQG